MRSGSGAFLEAGIVTIGTGELHARRHGPYVLSDVAPRRRRGRWRPRGALGLSPSRRRLAKPRTHAAVRRQRASGRQHVEGQHRPERRRGHGASTSRASKRSSVSPARSPPTRAWWSVPTTSTSSCSTTSTSARATPLTAGRVDELSSLASATLHAFEDRPFKLRSLVNALSAAAQGRHVIVWSADPRTEAVWRDVGIAGQLTSSSLMATVINRGGNKLDQYLSDDVVAPAHDQRAEDGRSNSP